MTKPALSLGIDLGGTNLRAGIVSQDGELIEFVYRSIDVNSSGDDIVSEIAQTVQELEHLRQVIGAGVAFAGAVLPDSEICEDLTNLPNLVNYPLRAEISRTLNLPCKMDNDAVLALFGECCFGTGRGYSDVLLLTIGTGIGGGLLLNGRLRRGSHGIGCEVGMLPFPDPDMGHLTPFEFIASPKSIMERLGNPQGHLYERADNGDMEALEAIREMYQMLGWLVTNMHVALDLEMIILSGGLASVGEPLCKGVQKAFQEICPRELQFDLQVKLGMLPAHAAGVVGAASLFFESELKFANSGCCGVQVRTS